MPDAPDPAAPAPPAPRRPRARGALVPTLALLLTVAGLAALVAGVAPVGPSWLPGAGAVAVSTVATWALSVRSGGRPLLFGAIALGVGLLAVLHGQPWERAGAATGVAAVSATLAVMGTTPARRFRQAAREAVLAVLVAAVGALAAVGFEPRVRVASLEFAVLLLSLVLVLALVYRLGAGWHGLGRRGLVLVVAGGAALAVSVLYAELLRRYGDLGLVDRLVEAVAWSRTHLGAFPRPVVLLLGVPALVWGTHMRARRRQGWWVCAFGVGATAPVATVLAVPTVSLGEAGLAVLYALVGGLALGYLVIRLDLAFTGPRGRRARRTEESRALRPEPPRTAPLS